MNEMTIDSTKLRQWVSEEIDLIADDQLAGFYQLVHYFRLGSQVASSDTMINNNGHHMDLLNPKKGPSVSKNGSEPTDEYGRTPREITLSLAGSWSDMSDEEFDDFLSDIYARRRGEHLVSVS